MYFRVIIFISKWIGYVKVTKRIFIFNMFLFMQLVCFMLQVVIMV